MSGGSSLAAAVWASCSALESTATIGLPAHRRIQGASHARPLGSNQVCNFRCAFGMKPIRGILDNTISIRDAFVLPQVLKPGVDEKGLHHPSFDRSILENGPRICAVTPTLLTKLFKHSEEWFAIPWIDTIFHCDQHRSSILL